MLHSRVARSDILAFARMGCEVTVCGPPTLIPRGIEALGCEVRHTLDDLGEADVVYALRMQQRADEGRPSCRRCASTPPATRSTAAASDRDQLLMHPGPVNRGVELSAEVIDSPQALIVEQVESGVVVRMAVLYELLTAGQGGGRTPASACRATSRPSRTRRVSKLNATSSAPEAGGSTALRSPTPRS